MVLGAKLWLAKKRFRYQFPKIFDEERKGAIREFKASLLLKEGAVPVFHKPYQMPYALKPAVEKEITQLVSEGVLEPVRYSEWASPIVIVPRKSGNKIRLCVDFKVTLNPNLKMDHYPLPLVEDVLNSVEGCEFFCVIDLTNAYLQLEVDEDSKALLTINTHLGLFRFNRLPFGVKCAPAQFQAIMDQIVKGLRHTACYLDDVIVAGKTREECVQNVEELFTRLNRYNVKVNLDKCKFFVSEVEFLGFQLSGEGLKLLTSKVEAIRDAPIPRNLTQLRSYLGLLNYYRRFLPMISSVLQPLYQLEKKDVPFVWTKECDRAFRTSKEMLIKSPVLAQYNPSLPLILTTDASPYGVGAVLSHLIDGVERPIQFASSTLSDNEQNYAQIQKEALAIIFGVKKFHKFIYGQKFVLHCDHQPLKTILGPKTGVPTLAATRLQRWSLILANYDYDLIYKKSSEVMVADALSRLPLDQPTPDVYVTHSINSFQELSLSAMDIVNYTKKDQVLQKVLYYTKNGWPANSDSSLKHYRLRQNELSVENECLLWGNRVVIPHQLRPALLELLHDQHVGIVRMKMLARGELWWPQMDDDIENFAKHCIPCQLNAPTPPHSFVSWPKTERPFQRIHLDFLQKDSHYMLLSVDSFSKWLDIHLVPSTQSSTTISKLRTNFAIFGLPEEIVSDNGPPFNGEEYKQFCLQNGIKYTLIPPNHPQSNGYAEKQVSTIKQNLRKQLEDNESKGTKIPLQHQIDCFLFSYRNTPHSVTGTKPSELVFRKTPRTKLSLLHPTFLKKQDRKGSSEKVRMFTEGKRVLALIHRFNKSSWVPAKIVKSVSLSTYLVQINDEIRFLHADQLKSYFVKEPNPLPTHIPQETPLPTPEIEKTPTLEPEVKETPPPLLTSPTAAERSLEDLRSPMLPATSTVECRQDSPATTLELPSSNGSPIAQATRHSRFGRKIKTPKRLNL